MEQISRTSIQAKAFEFALMELIYSKRDSFQPLWSVDSWVKFLIWLSLNCGLSGEKESLELFAQAMGSPLTSRMRNIFFERALEDLSLHVMADPAEAQVLIMPITIDKEIDDKDIVQALQTIGLSEKVSLSSAAWERHDSIVAIPWNVKSDI
ncbi:protein phosphatase [Prochlorococcus marinus]|uniref:protein phosphatase n=1 Tax=Prochlorococcus marinus TaxID=1219 RepID=UPI0022B3852E|nr:protein phosphatase [Prochlorococcus marinus]